MHQRLPSLRYLSFVVLSIGIVGFLLISSTLKAPNAARSKEIYAFYGLQHPDAEVASDSQQPEQPQQLETLPQPAQPIFLPLDALGEVSDTLTESQCTEGFPELYDAIDSTLRYFFLGQTRITPEDVDIAWRSEASLPTPGGAVRFLIHKNELRILETRGVFGHAEYHERAMGILNLIQRALSAASAGGEILPTIEVSGESERALSLLGSRWMAGFLDSKICYPSRIIENNRLSF